MMISNGIFSVQIGANTSGGIQPSVFVPPGPRWIEIEVGGNLLGPRAQPISVPYAYHASSATNAGTATFAQSATTASFLLGGAGGGAIPIGGILPYAGSTAPNGFRLCDGSEVSRTGTFASLFVVISTSFGAGDGTNTFNLPDLRGRFPLGADNMGGTSADRVTATQADNLGQGAGEENHTLTTSEMPSHNHTFTWGEKEGKPPLGNAESWDNVGTNTHPTSFAGGSQPHNNMPPYQTINYIIKH